MKAMIALKRGLAAFLSLSGIHLLMERFCFSNRAPVLMYHRVLADSNNLPFFIHPGMFVTPSTLEKQIVYLKEKFNIIFLDDLVDKFLLKENIGGYCSITFDDGWVDNYTNAFPLLLKYHIPATIFITTGFMDTEKLFWPEEICYYLDLFLIKKPNHTGASTSFKKYTEEMSRYQYCNREVLFDKAVERLKEYSQDEREEILNRFRSIYSTGSFPRQMLSWDEAKEMLMSGLVRFGSHTDNHVILDQVGDASINNEITVSRDKIQNRLGIKVRTFAYPNGNHNENIHKILAANGFDIAVTTRKGYLGPEISPIEIPRIGIHDDISSTIPMFRSRILLQKF
jgi:peptidoglycan/xylan/chitin deacetylase (PgdA/CDA1 family)